MLRVEVARPDGNGKFLRGQHSVIDINSKVLGGRKWTSVFEQAGLNPGEAIKDRRWDCMSVFVDGGDTGGARRIDERWRDDYSEVGGG